MFNIKAETRTHTRTQLARERVAAGAKILSDLDPHWYDKITLDWFDMGDWPHDILSQLYGTYAVGMERIAKHLGREWCVNVFGAEFGFNEGRHSDPSYAELTAEWERLIRELVK